MEVKKNQGKDVSKDGYNVVLIPNDVLDIIRTKLGDEVLLVYNDETNELTMIKKPDSFTKALRGLGKDMWTSVGGTEYIDQERKTWE